MVGWLRSSRLGVGVVDLGDAEGEALRKMHQRARTLLPDQRKSNSRRTLMPADFTGYRPMMYCYDSSKVGANGWYEEASDSAVRSPGNPAIPSSS